MSCASCSEPVKRRASRRTGWSYWRTRASKAFREPFWASRISSVSVARPHASLAMPEEDCNVRFGAQAEPPALIDPCDVKRSASAAIVAPRYPHSTAVPRTKLKAIGKHAGGQIGKHPGHQVDGKS